MKTLKMAKLSNKEKYGRAFNTLTLHLCRIEMDGQKMTWQKENIIGALMIAFEVLKEKLDKLEGDT